MMKLLGNIIANHGGDPKYRTVKTTNKKLNALIFAYPQLVNILKLIGFYPVKTDNT